MAVAGGAVRESARRTYSATTLPFSASLAATFWPALFSCVVVATWYAAMSVVRVRVRVRVNKTLTCGAAIFGLVARSVGDGSKDLVIT